jgi:WD40 repeat protein
MNTSTLNSKEFEEKFKATLSDYVTAITWSPVDKTLAITSAAGEVALWKDELKILQTENKQSVDCVAFSYDGKYLAVGGQNGQVKIWEDTELIATLDNPRAWVDKLVWNPTKNELAFSVNRHIQIWDADKREAITTLDFEDSSPMDMDWRRDGKYLAVGGNKGIKVWHRLDWDEECYVLEMPTVSLAIAWSFDGNFLASGNMDKTLAVLESDLLISGEDPQPWVMRGFPGKIRNLAWSEINAAIGAPLLASCSAEGIVIWEKLEDESLGWEASILTNHVDIIQNIEFSPKSFNLASAAADGWICLWDKNKQVSQILTGPEAGFSCLAWHPQGQLLAGGGDGGEIFIWTKSQQGKGFGKK